MPGACKERHRNFAVAAIYNACVMKGVQVALLRSLKSLPSCAEHGETVFTRRHDKPRAQQDQSPLQRPALSRNVPTGLCAPTVTAAG